MFLLSERAHYSAIKAGVKAVAITGSVPILRQTQQVFETIQTLETPKNWGCEKCFSPVQLSQIVQIIPFARIGDHAMTTQKTISASELRDHIRTVINEVHYGQVEYLVLKFGQPAAVIISPADFQLLQQARQQVNATGPTPPQGQDPESLT
jgi:prevent-host-death family protein